jgi:diacylglycerol kinase family enzyme
VLAVLLNPASGGTRDAGMRGRIEQIFRSHGLDVTIDELTSPGDTKVTVRAALDRNVEGIVAGGGDGTINAVASVLVGGSTPLGVLPLGTLNHFAKDLGIPVDIDKAIETIAARQIRRVDVGRVGDRIFLNNSSIGVYPSIIELRERFRQLGRAKWTALALATLHVLRRGEEVTVRLDSRQTRVTARTPFLFIGNNEYLVEGIHLGGRSRLDGGRLSAYFAPPVRTRHLPNLLAHAVLGSAVREHALEAMTAEELWVGTPSSRAMKVACDGELLTLTPPLHFRIWPGALNVIAPAA